MYCRSVLSTLANAVTTVHRTGGEFEQFDGHVVEATQEVAVLPRAGRKRGVRVVGPSIKQ
jgi:hypothetical protein